MIRCPKVHAIRTLPSGRAISRCSWKPNDWILADVEAQVTCERCLSALKSDLESAALFNKAEEQHRDRAEKKQFQAFLQREKYLQPEPGNKRTGDNTK
jgi:hypothetical protein